MNKEHIIQFAVGIDDDAIIKSVMEHAEKKIINDIKVEILSHMFEGRYYNSKPVTVDNFSGKVKVDRDANFNDAVSELIARTFSEFKDEIIKAAAKELADSMKRTKAVKESINKAIKDI